LYIRFVYGLRLLGQNEVNHSKLQNRENPCKHRRNQALPKKAKGRFRITKPLLYHGAKLAKMTKKPSDNYFGRVRVNGKLIRRFCQSLF